MIHYYILVDNEPKEVELLDWARWYEDNQPASIVARDRIGPVEVSTVFLGFDHGLGQREGPPVLFETMVFGGPLDQTQVRYARHAEAKAGHKQMVERVSERIQGDES